MCCQFLVKVMTFLREESPKRNFNSFAVSSPAPSA